MIRSLLYVPMAAVVPCCARRAAAPASDEAHSPGATTWWSRRGFCDPRAMRPSQGWEPTYNLTVITLAASIGDRTVRVKRDSQRGGGGGSAARLPARQLPAPAHRGEGRHRPLTDHTAAFTANRGCRPRSLLRAQLARRSTDGRDESRYGAS